VLAWYTPHSQNVDVGSGEGRGQHRAGFGVPRTRVVSWDVAPCTMVEVYRRFRGDSLDQFVVAGLCSVRIIPSFIGLSGRVI
jgi:hypothetical protein